MYRYVSAFLVSAVLILETSVLPAQARSTDLTKIEFSAFNYLSGCHGLSFFDPVINNKRFDFQGKSLAGNAKMSVDFSANPPTVKITGNQLNGSRTTVKANNNSMLFSVKLYHVEGVCTFNFLVKERQADPVPAAAPSPAPSPAPSTAASSGGNGPDLNNLTQAKAICADIGFVPSTEKFGECVLRLLEK